MRGMSNVELGLELGLSDRQVKRELALAARAGVVEEVRNKLVEALEKTPMVLSAIMDSSVEDLQENSRGWKLKLDAANSLNTGLGAYRPESHRTETKVTLESIASELKDVTPDGLERDKYGFPIRKRVAFQPDVEAE